MGRVIVAFETNIIPFIFLKNAISHLNLADCVLFIQLCYQEISAKKC